jgi:Protein of unknown function (DUF3485)
MRSALGPILVSIVLVASLGVVHGVYTDRWGPSGKLEQAVGGLSRLPSQLGDWTGEDVPHDAEELARAGIRGGVFRKYTNTRTRETVSFLIVCGRGGPISVHTPDICYAGAGYRQLEKEQVSDVEIADGTKHSFKIARFVKPGAVVPAQLEIFWSWSRDGVVWQAPENPRLVLARSPALYKIYVVREFMPKSRGESVPSCETFLRQALPAIRQSLPSSGS